MASQKNGHTTNLEIADATVRIPQRKVTRLAKAVATTIRPGTGDTGASLTTEILRTDEIRLIAETIAVIRVIDVIDETAGTVVTAQSTMIAVGETLLGTTTTSEITSTATAERTGVVIGIMTKTGIMIGTATGVRTTTRMTTVEKSRLPKAISRDCVRTLRRLFGHSKPSYHVRAD